MVPIPKLLLHLCRIDLPKTAPVLPEMEHPPFPAFSALLEGEEQDPELILEHRTPAFLG